MSRATFIFSESNQMSIGKKLVFVLTFFLITPITLLTSFLSLSVLSKTDNDLKSSTLTETAINFPKSGVQVFASLPSSFPSVSGEITASDAKVGFIKQYLQKNNSPLEPYSELIVDTANKYGLDYRLTTAIAQKESGLCKAIPDDSNNCWGWGIHSKGTLTFNSFDEGIEAVSRGLKEYYLDMGYLTVEEIMTKYAHPSSTTWADGVLHYMNEIGN